jgi:hypothetical protein
MHRLRVPDRRERNLLDVRELRWLVPGDVLRHLSHAVRPANVRLVRRHVRHVPHAVQSTHVSGDVPNLRDPVQSGDMCDMPDPVQSGDVCDMPDAVQPGDLQDVRDLWRGRHVSRVHARDVFQYVRTLLMRV